MSGTDDHNNDKKDANGFFEVGIITGSVGLKGEIKVFPTTDDPERFRLLKTVYINGESRAILNIRFQKNLIILKIHGLDAPEAAQALKGVQLMIPPELALPLEDDQYYHRDLLDMVVCERLPTGERLPFGTLTKILSTGANDVYVIKHVNGGEILIPAIKKCILNVDVPGKIMTVALISGLG